MTTVLLCDPGPESRRLIEAALRFAGCRVESATTSKQTRYLLRGVWGPAAVEKTEYPRVYVNGIRHKAEPDPTRPRYFVTAPGVGLRFQPDAGRVSQPC